MSDDELLAAIVDLVADFETGGDHLASFSVGAIDTTAQRRSLIEGAVKQAMKTKRRITIRVLP